MYLNWVKTNQKNAQCAQASGKTVQAEEHMDYKSVNIPILRISCKVNRNVRSETKYQDKYYTHWQRRLHPLDLN